jgi:excisionase family DNA binding protein
MHAMLDQLMAEQRILLTVRQVVEMTGYSNQFIRDEINRGTLPAVKKRDTIRIAVDDLRRWIEQDRQAA